MPLFLSLCVCVCACSYYIHFYCHLSIPFRAQLPSNKLCSILCSARDFTTCSRYARSLTLIWRRAANIFNLFKKFSTCLSLPCLPLPVLACLTCYVGRQQQEKKPHFMTDQTTFYLAYSPLTLTLSLPRSPSFSFFVSISGAIPLRCI